MNDSFSEILKSFRTEKNLSQQQLADMLFVERTTIANWESGRRTPDAVLLLQISKCLDIDVNILLETISNTVEVPNIMMVDDESIILKSGMAVIANLLPNASLTGFSSPTEALSFAKSNRVHLAYIDIEMGKLNGLELCRELLKINPRTNVFYLTAYPDYALEAWDTGACGFAVKPLTAEQARNHLTRLKFPIRGLQL
ncbi:MAG: response regulator [Clostridia bacterium]|nr:response regulator [Clostridia bacterium]